MDASIVDLAKSLVEKDLAEWKEIQDKRVELLCEYMTELRVYEQQIPKRFHFITVEEKSKSKDQHPLILRQSEMAEDLSAMLISLFKIAVITGANLDKIELCLSK